MKDELEIDAEAVDTPAPVKATYTENQIRTLDWVDHLRARPGMYIGKTGDDSQDDDGIYVLLKEVLDNSIDEYMMGYGKSITVDIAEDGTTTVRDFGRGIPLGSLIDAVSKINTSGKFDSEAFQKSVGLNGVGLKAVNALSDSFEVAAYREGQRRVATFVKAVMTSDSGLESTEDEDGTLVRFHPDASIFPGYAYRFETVENLIRNFTFLNTGLSIVLNGGLILNDLPTALALPPWTPQPA